MPRYIVIVNYMIFLSFQRQMVDNPQFSRQEGQ